MKCPNCNGTTFKPFDLTNGNNKLNVRCFECCDCGRIEMYSINSSTIKEMADRALNEKINRISKEIDDQIELINSLKSELASIKKIIANDNNSVKDVREAKNKLMPLKERIAYETSVLDKQKAELAQFSSKKQ